MSFPNILIAIGALIVVGFLWHALGAEITVFIGGLSALIVGLVWKAVDNATK